MKKHLSYLSYTLFFVLFFTGALHAQTYIINTIAGSGGSGFSGDGGLSIFATFDQQEGVAANRAGTVVYVADARDHRIRKVVNGSVISTYAGSGPTGTTVGAYGGDGGPAISARLNAPFGIVLDSLDNLYIADNQNYRIRVVNASGIISTICGTGVAGYTGDGGQATLAKIGYSQGITVDAHGNVYYSDLGYNVVRKITPSGTITTVAGNGVADSTGDGGPATAASLYAPRGLAVDPAGNIFIADHGNNRIRKVNPAGIISTFLRQSAGDVHLDLAGNLYYSGIESIYEVDSTGALIRYCSAIDSPRGFSGDGCIDTFAKTSGPTYFSLDSIGDVFFNDPLVYRIREVSLNHKPFFIAGHTQSLTVCEDSTLLLNSQLSINDSDYHQSEQWTVISVPSHGTLSATAIDTSTGGVLAPPGFYYNPDIGYSGSDVFIVVITDCTGNSDTTSISVTVNNCSLGTPVSASVPQALHIFPNPGSGQFSFRITSGMPGMGAVSIKDVMGRTVQQFALTLNVPTQIACPLAPGLYFVTATTETARFNQMLEIR